MAKLVIDLQQDALNNSVPVESLLRKALAVSVKTGSTEIQDWINHELNGYDPNKGDIPKYRHIMGKIKAYNPYQGWIPVIFYDEELRVAASTQINIQSIGEISKLSELDSLRGDVSTELKNELRKQNGVVFDICIFMSQTSMIGILETVRNIILNWALKLEQNGVLGDDMEFSEDEKNKARSVNYTITNNIGEMHNSQIQQLSENSSQLNYIDLLDEIITRSKQILDEADLPKNIKKELLVEVTTLESQRKSPKPKKQIISESLRSIRNIAEGMTGSIIATGILGLISRLGAF